MVEFVQGLHLSERYYQQAVRPILNRHFPTLEHAAGLIGWGSEVLGYDTPRSRDHHWGPRLLLFIPEDNYEATKAEISKMLSNALPYTFLGYSTNFGPADNRGVRLMQQITSGPINHMAEVFTVRSFFEKYLNLDIDAQITPVDWLTIPEHRLLGSVSGKVFHDGPGDLTKVRQKLAYYPRDVWLYMLAAQWAKIAAEEAFIGRCGELGDELGSAVVTSRVVSDLMRLCFLIEQKYAPYPKWIGTAFSHLGSGRDLVPIFQKVLRSTKLHEREVQLTDAYRKIAEKFNLLNIASPLETSVQNYYNRPYQVLFADRFANSIEQAITDPEVRKLAPRLGSVTQFSDSGEPFDDVEFRQNLKTLYRGPER